MVRRPRLEISTARGIAMLRAVESERPAGERILHDPHARSFAGPLGLAMTRLSVRAGMMNLLGIGPIVTFALVRERAIEEIMHREVADGATQLVVLGAGFDTRAYRLPADREVAVFEVDHPVTQQGKRNALAKAALLPPATVAFVSVDFDRDDLGARLADAGYDPARRAVFVWQGVTMYLTPEGIDRTLAFIALHSGPRSLLVFDYMESAMVERLNRPSFLSAFTRAVGENVVFGIASAELEPFLTARGFTDVGRIGADDLKAAYLGGVNRKRVVEPAMAIATARVPG